MTIFKRLAALCLVAPTLAHAALTMSTRVIYEETQGEATVQVRYPGSGFPLLMQAWLDDGSKANPKEQNLPFLLTPAVSRIAAGQAQTVRILQTRDELPKDRESLFYFNVLEVPPTSADLIDAPQNSLQFAAHTRVKFFYRPRGLTPTPEAALQQLRFTLENAAVTVDDTGAQLHVRVHNPTPYHITLRDARGGCTRFGNGWHRVRYAGIGRARCSTTGPCGCPHGCIARAAALARCGVLACGDAYCVWCDQ